MNTHEFYFTESAKTAFRGIIEQIQQVSLIAAERMRNKIFHKLHLIHHHPLQGSKKIEVANTPGHYRLASVLTYKIYYKVEDKRIIVMDILQDKESVNDKN